MLGIDVMSLKAGCAGVELVLLSMFQTWKARAGDCPFPVFKFHKLLSDA